jgi:NAD(P)-dependent dehydrogenase (short-subunit alcohol dehydrogenase family)
MASGDTSPSVWPRRARESSSTAATDRAGEAVVERVKRQGGDVSLLIADLSSLAEVRSRAEAVRRNVNGLEVLTNDAGIGKSAATRAQRRRVRTAVSGQLPCRVSFEAPPPANAREPRLVVHYQRRLGGTADDRL